MGLAVCEPRGTPQTERERREIAARSRSVTALAAAWREAVDPYEREHVTPFIWRRPDRFRSANVADAVDRSSWRLTLDTAEDLLQIRKLHHRLRQRGTFGLAEIVDLRQTIA